MQQLSLQQPRSLNRSGFDRLYEAASPSCSAHRSRLDLKRETARRCEVWLLRMRGCNALRNRRRAGWLAMPLIR
jgi:hypothetical protein